eukprot:gene6659-8238_t
MSQIIRQAYHLYRDLVHLDFLKPVTEKVIFSFKDQNSIKNWKIISDKEVGGFTEGTFKLSSDQQYAIFSGKLSKQLPTDNPDIKSSGYIGAYSPKGSKIIEDTDIANYDTFSIRVNTEGRTYAMGILKNNEKFTMYKSLFTTAPDTWETVELPILDFFKVNRGVVQLDLSMSSKENIDSIGFVQTGPKDGPFQLKVEYIKLKKSESSSKQSGLDSRATFSNGKSISSPEYE